MGQRPNFSEEELLREQGYELIAGVDEAGRGPLAGPVVAAAVILPLATHPSWLAQVQDSKQLPALQREFLYDCIREEALAWGVGVISPQAIDAEGIVAATRQAMKLAVEGLSQSPALLLIDHLRVPALPIPQKPLVKGDCRSLSIAAASIVAKVTRDRIMMELDGQFPGYGFSQNKGYATPEHLLCLRRLGACPVHRRSFAPVREALGGE